MAFVKIDDFNWIDPEAVGAIERVGTTFEPSPETNKPIEYKLDETIFRSKSGDVLLHLKTKARVPDGGRSDHHHSEAILAVCEKRDFEPFV